FAFGFEAIDNAADRALLMERIMDYFEDSTSVESQGEIASHPQNFFLSPNYPNPFNATTVLSLTIPGDEPMPASLKIYNVLGQEVRTLVDGIVSPGRHIILWDGTDDTGWDLASGVYFSRLDAGGFTQTRKLVLSR
ncbi:T9SS type A sorting domain-containing protein, partial [bacterium]|nr:T9SS type A sorting domain-containing protein [bacterium]